MIRFSKDPAIDLRLNLKIRLYNLKKLNPALTKRIPNKRLVVMKRICWRVQVWGLDIIRKLISLFGASIAMKSDILGETAQINQCKSLVNIVGQETTPCQSPALNICVSNAIKQGTEHLIVPQTLQKNALNAGKQGITRANVWSKFLNLKKRKWKKWSVFSAIKEVMWNANPLWKKLK